MQRMRTDLLFNNELREQGMTPSHYGRCYADLAQRPTAGQVPQPQVVEKALLTRHRKGVIVQAIVYQHHPLGVALVLAVHIAALCLDVIRCDLPPKEAAAQLLLLELLLETKARFGLSPC